MNKCKTHTAVFILSVVFFCVLVSGSVLASQGSTEIHDWYDLDEVRDDLDADYVLMSDLDESTAGYSELVETDYGWEPLGKQGNPFTGTLDGQGYEIQDLVLARGGENYVGLFGYIGSGGAVENLVLSDVSVEGGDSVGGLVGHAEGADLEKVGVTGSVGGDFQVGGLVGFLGSGSVLGSSYSDVTIESVDERVGGLVGFFGSMSEIRNSYFSGDIKYGGDLSGGIAGYASSSSGTIHKTYSIGSVPSASTVGGLVGRSYALVQDSINVYEKTGNHDIVGDNRGSVESSYSKTVDESGDFITFDQLGWDIEKLLDSSKDLNDGFPFLSWQQGGEYTWKVFDPTLTVEIVEPDGGEVIEPGTGEFERDYGDEVPLKAEPDQGNYFVHWLSHDDPWAEIENITSKDTVLHMERYYTIEPIFSSYRQLTVHSQEGGDVVEPGTGVFEYRRGENVELLVEPHEYYRFGGWTGDKESKEKNTSFYIYEDMELWAHFLEESEFEVEIVSPETGDVYGQGGPVYIEYTLTNVGEITGSQDIALEIKDSSDEVVHEDNEMVELDQGEQYEGSFSWIADDSERSPYKLELSASDDEDSVSIETVDKFTLEISVHGDGETIPSEGVHDYKYDEVVTIETISGDSTFSHWSGDYPTGERRIDEISFEMDKDRELMAYFEDVNEEVDYSLTIDIDGEGETDPHPGEHTYNEGEFVPVEAHPDDGWYLSEWDGNYLNHYSETDAEITVGMEDDVTLTAGFEEIPEYYELTVDTEGEGDVDIDPDRDEYEEGKNVTLNATPDDGWEFVEWKGDKESNVSAINLTMDDDIYLKSVFEELEFYKLDVGTFGEGQVDIEPDRDEYEEGKNVTLNATPDDGWEFGSWEGCVVSSATEINVTMNESKSIDALFLEKPPYDLDINISGEGEVLVTPDRDEYESDEEVDLTAVPESEWKFIDWSGDREETEKEITLVMNSSKSLEANFREEDWDYPEISVDENIDLGLYPGDSEEVPLDIENTDDSELSIAVGIEDLEDFIEVDQESFDLEPGDVKTVYLTFDVQEGTDPGDHDGSAVIDVDDIEGHTEVSIQFEVLEDTADALVDMEPGEDILNLEPSLPKTEFEEGETVTININLENKHEESIEIFFEASIFTEEGDYIDGFFEQMDLQGFDVVSHEIDDLGAGTYVLEASLEPEQEGLVDSAETSTTFVVKGGGLGILWILIVVVMVLAATGVYFAVKEDLIPLPVDIFSGESVPPRVENLIEMHLERGYSREQIRDILIDSSEDPEWVDKYFERS